MFVHPGDTARVFVVGDEPDLRPDDVFTAEVEYLGGPAGGELQLLRLEDRSGLGLSLRRDDRPTSMTAPREVRE